MIPSQEKWKTIMRLYRRVSRLNIFKKNYLNAVYGVIGAQGKGIQLKRTI